VLRQGVALAAPPMPSRYAPLTATELADSPWNPGLKLLRARLQARRIATDQLRRCAWHDFPLLSNPKN